ncbi:MAG: hypothetical protein ACOYXC_15845 [Candidatus Rifleibacteriota bacterium]
MPKIWVMHPGAIVFSFIFVFFLVFLGWLIATKVLRPWLFPTALEAESPAVKNTSLPGMIFGLSVLYGPFVIGIIWGWLTPSFMTLDAVGNLDFRNPFFYSLVHIPFSEPRTMEASIIKDPWAEEAVVFYGDVLFSFADSRTEKITFQLFPTNGDNAAFFEDLGFSGTDLWEKGPGGGLLTPMHCFSASGPVYLEAEKMESSPAKAGN